MEQNIPGIVKVRTAQKARLRGMPQQKGGEHLSLYVAEMKLDRLEREREIALRRTERLEEERSELCADMRELEGQITGRAGASESGVEGAPSTRRKKSTPPGMKKMDLQY